MLFEVHLFSIWLTNCDSFSVLLHAADQFGLRLYIRIHVDYRRREEHIFE